MHLVLFCFPVKLDICQREYLNITCSRGEVILMMSAENGIMRLGRCFRTEGVNSVKEVIGCKTEALDHLDAICSGRRSCLFQYPDDYLYNNNNCPNIFTSFMEVSYICVKGMVYIDCLKSVLFIYLFIYLFIFKFFWGDSL